MVDGDRSHVDLPSAWKAYAETHLPTTVDVYAVWREYVEWMAARGHDITQDTWSKWVDRRKPKPDKPGRVVPEAHHVWDGDKHWEPRASKLEALAHLNQITANLDAIGRGQAAKEVAEPTRPSSESSSDETNLSGEGADVGNLVTDGL